MHGISPSPPSTSRPPSAPATALELKPDFGRARERWDRYWRDECTDRPPIRIVLPGPGRKPPPCPHPYSVPHGDIARAAAQTLDWAAAQEWLGEAVPGCLIAFAPDHFALLLGADLRYDDGSASGTSTGWVLPCLKDYDSEIRFRPEGKWWEKTAECIRVFRRVCDGRMIVAGPNLQGGLDALAALRGPQTLLSDLLDCPADVHRALARIDAAMAAVRQALAEALDIARWGSLTRHGTYGSGLVDVPQCDFSAMIGEAAFREFELPSLRNECAGAQGCIYHLDGKEAIRHLPALAEVPGLHAIQWQPGAAGAGRDWSALFARIDALGLGQMRGGTRDQIMRLWHGLRMRHRLYVSHVADIGSAAEAEAFLNSFQKTGEPRRKGKRQ
jgi:hypothetical protein